MLLTLKNENEFQKICQAIYFHNTKISYFVLLPNNSANQKRVRRYACH